MIFILASKTWHRQKKKLVQPKDYMLIDGTEDDDAKLSSFTNCVTMDQYNPPIRLVKLLGKSEESDDYRDILDYDRVEKLEENFFDSPNLRAAIMATVGGLLQGDDINIFLVLRNKVFKYYAKRLRREFIRNIAVTFDYVTVFNPKKSPADYQQALHKSFTDKELEELEKALSEREKRLEKLMKRKKKKKKK